MMGFRDRHAIAPYWSVRIGVVLSTFLYVLISLNPSDFASALLKRLSAGTTVKTEAISIPEASMPKAAKGENPVARGSEHPCCCRHSGATCEMGCCRGVTGKDSVSDESCYRQCPGTDAAGNPEAPKLPTHLASCEITAVADPDFPLHFPAPCGAPAASFRSPPGKVPLV